MPGRLGRGVEDAAGLSGRGGAAARFFRGPFRGTSVAVIAERDRPPGDVVKISDETLGNGGRRCRVGELHLAFVTDEGVAKEHDQRRNPDLESRSDATQASIVQGVDAAISL